MDSFADVSTHERDNIAAQIEVVSEDEESCIFDDELADNMVEDDLVDDPTWHPEPMVDQLSDAGRRLSSKDLLEQW